MRALLVGKLEEDLLAFGVLEFLAVSLEETIRPAFAFNPNHQGLAVVDPIREPLGRRGEKTIRRTLEEQEGRSRFELRILLQQIPISLLERCEVLLLLGREFFEHSTAACVPGQRDGARIELEAAAL